jgi:SAM-dependent methyltransferase
VRTHSPEERTRRASSFNEDAEKYDRARPTYPEELFDRLWDLAQLGSEPQVLEIGCGTGQASLALARRGARLTCVDYGANMAKIARRKLAPFQSASVIVSKFEEWTPDGRTFDLVFASASWHWVPPEVRFQRAAAALRPGGSIAVVRSDHFYPLDFDPLFMQIQDAYRAATGSRREVTPQPLPSPHAPDDKDQDLIQELKRCGAFDPPKLARVLWSFERTADEYTDLLGTYSDHWALEPEVRRRLFDDVHRVIAEGPTGSIRKHYVSTLLVARRR